MNKKIKRQIRTYKYSFRKFIFSIYALSKYNPKIWELLNASSIKTFKKEKPQLTPLQQKMVDGLTTDGIATTTLQELFPGENKLATLQAYVAQREDRAKQNHKKPFIDDLLSEIPELGFEIPFVEIALSPTILDIANTYLGLHSQLYHFMLRRTKRSINQLPLYSQNWHRAPQELKNCRVYIYLSEVSETSGPFMYIPQSTHGKKYSHVAAQTAFSRGYNSAEMIQNKIPLGDIHAVEGAAGTVIFCDSSGLHRGGYSVVDTRTMSTFGYGAPSLRENIHYSYSQKFYDSLNDKVAQAVLNPKWLRK